MGIEGAVGLVCKQGHAFSTSHSTLSTAKPSYLVIDATKSLDKLVLRHMNERVPYFDKLGYSIFHLAGFFRHLIKSLVSNQVVPLFVFNGGRKSEQHFGPHVSCADHFANSCRTTLRFIMQPNPGRNFDLPELATNALKQVICELKMEQNMYQATYEVYPTLTYLAHKFKCPVMTGHSDFVFHSAPAGFYWFDRVQLPLDPSQPITGTLYEHSRLLETYGLNEEHSSALRAFSTLLRPDFHRQYYNYLNGLFRLTGRMTMHVNTRDRMQTARLTHIMQTARDNPNLRSYESVHSFLRQIASASTHLMRDFESTHETYATHFEDFATTEFGQLLNRGPGQLMASQYPISPAAGVQLSRVQPADLESALTRRHSTAEFLFNLSNTTFFRPRVEDTSVPRSTFSLQDAARQYLLDNAMPSVFAELRLYDRCLTAMQERRLKRRQADRERLNVERLLQLFNTSSQELGAFTQQLASKHIDLEVASELALYFALARFAFQLAFRHSYSNDPPAAAPGDRLSSLRLSNNNNSALLGSRTSEVTPMRLVRDYEELRRDFYIALLNSLVYHAREHQGDQSPQTTPADIRVARDRLRREVVDIREPSIMPHSNHPQYLKMVHMLEALNSVAHAYIELNSLFNFPAPQLHVIRHYDSHLIYKIMSRLSNRFAGYLLELGPEFEQMLDLAPAALQET